MFTESLLSEWVPIHPQDVPDPKYPNWRDKQKQSLIESLSDQCIGKVVADLGIVLSISGISLIKSAPVLANEGYVRIHCEFYALVFQPVPGVVLDGIVLSCDPSGIVITLGFFSDVKIARPNLRHQSLYDEAEESWSWSYENELLPYTKGESIRFRILESVYGRSENSSTPLVIRGDLNDHGLGMKVWWED